MTSEIKILRTPDVSFSNQVINLHGARELGELKVSAASFIVSAKSYEASQIVLNFIYKSVVQNMPRYSVWLLLGNTAWQPGTRIVRYLGLWGGLKLRGIELPLHSRSVERTLESDGKLKFIGALCLSDFSALSTEMSVSALLAEQCSYVAILPEGLDIENVLGLGWCGSFSEDRTLCAYVSESQGLLLMRIGEFDDPDNGFVCIGEQGRLDDLLN